VPCGRENKTEKHGFAHHLNGKVKLLTAVICIAVLVNISSIKILSLGVILLMGLQFLAKVPLKTVFARIFIAVPFVGGILIFLPFTHDGTVQEFVVANIVVPVSIQGLLLAETLALRVVTAILIMVFVTETTPRTQLLSVIKQLPIPTVFTQLIDFIWRYLTVLRAELQRMQRAQKARGFVAKSYFHPRTLKISAETVGALFLRSFHRAQRVHWAVISRAYGRDDWSYQLYKQEPRVLDYCWGATLVAVAFMLLLLDKGGSQWFQLLK